MHQDDDTRDPKHNAPSTVAVAVGKQGNLRSAGPENSEGGHAPYLNDLPINGDVDFMTDAATKLLYDDLERMAAQMSEDFVAFSRDSANPRSSPLAYAKSTTPSATTPLTGRTKQTTVRLPIHVVERLNAEASRRGCKWQTLLNQLLDTATRRFESGR